MDPGTIQLRIDHLTGLDQRELAKLIAPDSVTFTNNRVAEGRLGELDTITAIVTVTLATINTVGTALALWLSSGGTKAEVIEHITRKRPDEDIEYKLVIRAVSKDGIQAEVIEQIRGAFPAGSSSSQAAKDE